MVATRNCGYNNGLIRINLSCLVGYPKVVICEAVPHAELFILFVLLLSFARLTISKAFRLFSLWLAFSHSVFRIAIQAETAYNWILLHATNLIIFFVLVSDSDYHFLHHYYRNVTSKASSGNTTTSSTRIFIDLSCRTTELIEINLHKNTKRSIV